LPAHRQFTIALLSAFRRHAGGKPAGKLAILGKPATIQQYISLIYKLFLREV